MTARRLPRKCPLCFVPFPGARPKQCPVCRHERGVPVALGSDTDRWRWVVAHPKQHAFLVSGPTQFARSLRYALVEFGSLTPKQQHALDRIIKEESP